MAEFLKRRSASAVSETGWALNSVVAALRESREVTYKIRHRGHVRELPSRAALEEILEALAAALFPTHYAEYDLSDENIDFFVSSALNNALTGLAEQVRRGLRFGPEDETTRDEEYLRQRADEITRGFSEQLPAIRALLVSDLLAAFQGDPAASSISEILLCYPGMSAVTCYRLAHALHRLGAPLIARLIAEIAHSKTGIDIHPGAEIGRGFFIDHGTGVVIGATAIIGNNVRLYQAVTLGAKRFLTGSDGNLIKGEPRHPIIEDNVAIYAGATILGRITVGTDSTIGGNVWLTHSVPPGSIITQARNRHDTPE